jgi:hypothetical protein
MLRLICRRWTTPVRRWALMAAPLAALGCGPAATAQPQTAAAPAPLEAQDPSDLGKHWVRVVADDDGATLAMETAIVRFVPADDYVAGKPPADYSTFVDLVGAVHIGDKAYYDQLNRRFRFYDAVLYELVAPKGTVVPRGRGTSNAHLLGALQNGMKTMLEVEHQLEQIDYTRPNFVHADLSPDEFMKSMDDRDESFLEMYFRILGASIAQQSKQAAAGVNMDLDIMAALLSEDRARRLKIIMAKQFDGMESLMLAFSGEQGSTLITARNERALDVLEEQLDDGKRRLAIFYGAGHLGEMTEQLERRFDMKPVSIEWIEAWDLRAKDADAQK